jgi:hypothetical protein
LPLVGAWVLGFTHSFALLPIVAFLLYFLLWLPLLMLFLLMVTFWVCSSALFLAQLSVFLFFFLTLVHLGLVSGSHRPAVPGRCSFLRLSDLSNSLLMAQFHFLPLLLLLQKHAVQFFFCCGYMPPDAFICFCSLEFPSTTYPILPQAALLLHLLACQLPCFPVFLVLCPVVGLRQLLESLRHPWVAALVWVQEQACGFV